MPLADEDLQQIQTLINTGINGAVANMRKAADLQRDKDSKALTESLTKLLDDKLQAHVPPEPTEPGKKGGKESDREMATLRQQIADLKKISEESAASARAEREKNRSAALKTAVAEALEPLGITGARFRGAFALLSSLGMVKYASDDGDEISFVDAGGEVDYRTGLASWSKSDEAKIYLPPSGTAGAGTRPKGPTPPPKGGPVTPADRNQKILGVLGEWAENPR